MASEAEMRWVLVESTESKEKVAIGDGAVGIKVPMAKGEAGSKERRAVAIKRRPKKVVVVVAEAGSKGVGIKRRRETIAEVVDGITGSKEEVELVDETGSKEAVGAIGIKRPKTQGDEFGMGSKEEEGIGHKAEKRIGCTEEEKEKGIAAARRLATMRKSTWGNPWTWEEWDEWRAAYEAFKLYSPPINDFGDWDPASIREAMLEEVAEPYPYVGADGKKQRFSEPYVGADGKRKRMLRLSKLEIEVKMSLPRPTPYPGISEHLIKKLEEFDRPRARRIRAEEEEMAASTHKSIDRYDDIRRQYAIKGYADVEYTDEEMD